MTPAKQREWAWSQTIPLEEKLLLLALVEVEGKEPVASVDQETTLPLRLEQAAKLAHFPFNAARIAGRHLHTRGLIDAAAVPEPVRAV